MKWGSVSELAHWNMQSFPWEVTFLCTSCSQFWEIHILREKDRTSPFGEKLAGGGYSSPFGEKLAEGGCSLPFVENSLEEATPHPLGRSSLEAAVLSESQSLMEVCNESALCYCLPPRDFPRSWTQRILRPCSCSPKITNRIGAIKPEP